MKTLEKMFVPVFAFLIISFGLAGFHLDFNADEDAAVSVSYDIGSSLMVFATGGGDDDDEPPEVFEISTPTMFIGGFLLLLAVILVVVFLRRRKL